MRPRCLLRLIIIIQPETLLWPEFVVLPILDWKFMVLNPLSHLFPGIGYMLLLVVNVCW